MMKADKRANLDPMRLAWLLRADLRRGEPASGPVSDWFKMWWCINGAREYPAAADPTALRKAGLFQPLPGWPSHGGFGMTPALRFLLDTRPDLASAFDVGTEQGLWHAIAWLFVHGVREHRLASALDDAALAALDAVPPFFGSDAAADGEPPGITWLMFFVWRTSGDLQAHFDLRQAQGRQAYLSWFLFTGVPQLKLAPLVAPRWHAWLRQSVLRSAANVAVPRAALLLWQGHEQLQRAFDLQTDSGRWALGMWAAEVWNTQPELSWIGDGAPRPLAPPSPAAARPFGLNLIGFAFGELGIGEDVRMAVAACEAAGIPFTVVNIHPGDSLRQADQALAAHVTKTAQQADPAPYACNLFCLTAFDTARVFLERGNSLFEGRYNIGWWPWELPVWPADWQCVFDLVDEVWAATAFTHRMYAEAAASASQAPTPVTLMPMAATVDRVKPVSRKALGLPEDRFLFLYVFDFNSYLARKNPLAAVKAFRRAFDPADTSVGLVLKTMNSNPDNPAWRRFVRECAQDPRITILDRTLERGEVLGLIQNCDAYVSLHRAEGFGRTLLEAMLFGNPVVGTDFSGNKDFLNNNTGFPVEWKRRKVRAEDYPFIQNSDGAWWAEPCIESAAVQLHRAKFTNGSRELSVGLSQVAEQYSPASIGARMLSHLKSRNPSPGKAKES